jgi:O-antigen/teichoic acid export membrane protein
MLASGSIFFSNIFLKQYLSLNQYYEYSLCLTIFALLTSFGAMGFEQVFLRLSVINKKRISFDWKIVFFLVISSILTSVLSATYLNKNLESSFFLLFSLSLGIVIIMLLYNTFRITSYFLISQLISNSWKLIVFLFTIAIVLGRDIFSFFLESITSIIWMLIIFSILISRNLIEIKLDSNYSFRYIFLFGLIFFISLFTLSFLGQGDRILIDSYFNKADFNNYFYLSSIFLFPFSLLQSYVGFKELVKFKSKPVNLKKSVNKLIIYSLILSVVLLGSSFFLGKLNLL